MSNLILGMDGGASVTSKHRRKQHRKSGTSRIKGRELPTSSGDSADGELSDDSSDSDSSSADDQKTSRSSKMHKPSPKWNRQSRLQTSPKKSRISKENISARKLMVKDNSSSSSDDSDSDSNEDSSSEGSESNDNSSLDRQGLGRKPAKQIPTALSKSLKHSSSEDDSGNDLKIHKPTPDKFNGATKKLWSSIKPLENKKVEKNTDTPITKNDKTERPISKLFSNKIEKSLKELTKQERLNGYDFSSSDDSSKKLKLRTPVEKRTSGKVNQTTKVHKKGREGWIESSGKKEGVVIAAKKKRESFSGSGQVKISTESVPAKVDVLSSPSKKKKDLLETNFKRSDENVLKKSPIQVKQHTNGYASTSDLSDSDASSNLRLRNQLPEKHPSGKSSQKRKDESGETEKSRKETKICDKSNKVNNEMYQRRTNEDQVKIAKDRTSWSAEVAKRKSLEEEKIKENKSPKRGKPMPDSMKETVAESTAESAVDSPAMARSESSMATSGDTSDHMPELEPQVIVPPKAAVEKPQAMVPKARMENGHKVTQASPKYEKPGKKKGKEESKQMSIREFLMKKKKPSDALSSASSQEDEVAEKKHKHENVKELNNLKTLKNGKVKEVLGTTEAIEKKFNSNVGYLDAFESFMGDDDKDPKSLKEGKEISLLSKPCNVKVKKCSSNPVVPKNGNKEEGKTYTLLNSTMHPKRVIKKEKEKELIKEKEKERERERMKKLEAKEKERKIEENRKKEEERRIEKELEEKRQLEKEELKRKEEKKRLDRLKEEAKRKEKDEKRRLEKERIKQEKEEKSRIEKEKEQQRKLEEQLRADEKKRREKEEKAKQAEILEKGRKDKTKSPHSKTKSPRKEEIKVKEHQKEELKKSPKKENILKKELAEKSPKDQRIKVSHPEEVSVKSSQVEEISAPMPGKESTPNELSDKSFTADPSSIKTPKKHRKMWTQENESPDPKKKFIQKHQEQLLSQEQARQTSKNEQTSDNRKDSLKDRLKERRESGQKGPDDQRREESLLENLGYNSGDDVSRYSDDHLNKQPLVKPGTVLTKEISDEDSDKTPLQPVAPIPPPDAIIQPAVPIIPPVEPLAPIPPAEPLAPPPPPQPEEIKPVANCISEKPEEKPIEAPPPIFTEAKEVISNPQPEPVPIVEQPPPPPQAPQPVECLPPPPVPHQIQQLQQPLPQQQIPEAVLPQQASCMEEEKLQHQQQVAQQISMDQCAMVQQQHQQEQQLQMEQQQQQQAQQAAQVAQQQQQQQQQAQVAAVQQQQAAQAVQQQSQQYMGDMTGGYYTPETGTETAGQYYNGQDGKTDANTSLGVYTPDSATNSVHSMHGYPAHAGDGAEYHGDTSGEYSGQSAEYTGASESDPVHNTSVMESPSSIGSVEIPSVYDNCANSTTMAGHHRMNQNSPQQGITGHSPIHHQQPGITGQSPTALHNNLTKQSPIHHQQQPITSQSPHPHPIQSPHPQPSPHNQQSSPHPQILPSSPYTSLPHQSPTPQPAYQPTPTQPAPRQTSHSSKSPRQPSRTTQQPASNSQLTTQQQVAQQSLRSMQQQAAMAQYYQQFGGVPVASAQAGMTGHKSGHHRDATIFPGAMFPGAMFPACTTAGKQAGYMDASHAQAAQAAQAAAAAAQFYPSQQHPSHSSSQANSLVRLQHLTQSLDLQPPHGHIPSPTSQPVTSPPPVQRQSKSTKSSRQSSAASHAPPAPPTLPPGYPHYPPGTLHGAQMAAQGASRTATGQSRPPNVTINPSIMQQYNAMQQQYAYNAMLGNPALVNQMYHGQYDPQRNPGGQMYPGYGPYLNYR